MNVLKKPIHLLDNRRSYMSSKEIEKYRSQIVNQDNKPVCEDLSAIQVVRLGIEAMCRDRFRLVEADIDV